MRCSRLVPGYAGWASHDHIFLRLRRNLYLEESIGDAPAKARVKASAPTSRRQAAGAANTEHGHEFFVVPVWQESGTAGRLEDHMLRRQLGTILVLVVLFSFLAAAVWFMIWAWGMVEGPMSIHQRIAMILGIVFTCLVGFGLMGLIFFSSREGYDEPPRFILQDEDEPDDDGDATKR